MFFPEKIKSISRTSRVLEVGPGSMPHPRADVFLERTFCDENEYLEQCGMAAPNFDRDKTHYYDGGRFPFDDQEFDYVICSHVLEHIPRDELEQFIAELQRVAPRGYLEFPSAFYEVICFPAVHLWFLNHRAGEIILLNKADTKSNWVHRSLREMWYANDEYLREAFKRYENFFFIGFEWEDTIHYRITLDWDDLVTESEFNTWCRYFRELKPDRETQHPKARSRPIRARLSRLLRRLGVHPANFGVRK